MSIPGEIDRWSQRDEGQFFERKSALDRSKPRVTRRNAKEIAKDIVETLSAMANADGGELVLGIEDDGTTTGVPHPSDKVELFLSAPNNRNYVNPPLRARAEEVMISDKFRILHFAVNSSPLVHQLSDGRYLLRSQDKNLPWSADEIQALKATKSQSVFERTCPLGASMQDLDLQMVRKLFSRFDHEAPLETILSYFNLVESSNGGYVPTLALLLLFGKNPSRWHPRCGIDFILWEGTERQHGPNFNIVKRIAIEGPLTVFIENAYETIKPFIRKRQKLYDLFFTERLEYPTFVWQEAIVNAVAHRDYRIQGAQIEVHMFDDRIEIRSPGLPPPPVTIDALNKAQHIHLSRNPLIVRVLTDLGYMRELGEGIPRMFAEMEREGYYPPRFEDLGGVTFLVTLHNQPIYDQATLKWLSNFKKVKLTGDQKRLLAYAHAHGERFTSREYQKLVGIDIYGASFSIKDLINKGIVKRLRKGGRVYEVIEPEKMLEMPEELIELIPLFREKEELSNQDIREALGVKRHNALRIIARLMEEGWIFREGVKKGTRYRLAPYDYATP